MAYPTPASWWEHHSNGNIYTVITMANNHHHNEKYPVSVVYKGVNGNVWVKPFDNFLATMKEVSIMAYNSHQPWVLWGQTQYEYMAEHPEWRHPNDTDTEMLKD